MPTTLIVSVPLAHAPQTIVGMWSGVRGSTAIIDTPATLSAILDSRGGISDRTISARRAEAEG